MEKAQIDEMIKCQDLYEIEYEKDFEKRIWHISNIEYKKGYKGKCILAFCNESQSDLTFNIRKICSAKKYWVGILSEESRAPKDGIYLIAYAGIGQGVDIEYHLRMLKNGDLFLEDSGGWAKPIAFHYLPAYNVQDNEWTELNITMHTGEYEEIPAPKPGIAVLSYKNRHIAEDEINHDVIEYCLGNGRYYNGYYDLYKEDVSTFFKDHDLISFCGWSEIWDGSIILGLQMIQEYSQAACRRHIELRTSPIGD